ncbi:OmpA family protein [Salinimonas lutimaris]|uniref:OmpA family protein n=1 Tax=Salinimonas lutimaris TaxID=914153 RepID=UPI0010C02EBB|nr:OmpA family protein [Salinimonas lutimaris]
MKKTFNIAAVALAVMSANSFAQEDTSGKAYDSWIGLYGMYYNAEETKPADDLMDDGFGFGGEYGWRFDENWAIRGELTALDIDYQQVLGRDDSVSGVSYGVDAMYFMPDDLWYVFAGYKRQDFDENLNLADVGIGKHWDISDKVKLVTEIAAYYDFGQDYTDYSAKLGVVFPLGGSASSQPEPAPATPVDQDSDNDGVMNSVDECPNTPAGAEVDARGCEIVGDSDNDGVKDDKDMCPDTPMNDKVDADGCTVFEEEEVTHTLRVLFPHNSADVTDVNAENIEEFANFFKRYGKTEAVIEGHASAPGSESYNMDLSKRRAEAFKNVLVEEYGIDESRLTTEGFGESQLIDDSNTAEANRINRRIHIRVTAMVEVPEERN